MHSKDISTGKFIRDLHGTRISGHLGRHKFVASVEKKFHWPYVAKESCGKSCQKESSLTSS